MQDLSQQIESLSSILDQYSDSFARFQENVDRVNIVTPGFKNMV